MAHQRKHQFWLDVGSTLTDFSADINSVQPAYDTEFLDDTGLNADDVTGMPGIRTNSLSLNGYSNDAASGIQEVLDGMRGTSVSKTYQHKVGSYYYYGEVYLGAYNPGSGDGKSLITWSATLNVDGAVNKTSVSQA